MAVDSKSIWLICEEAVVVAAAVVIVAVKAVTVVVKAVMVVVLGEKVKDPPMEIVPEIVQVVLFQALSLYS